MKGWTIGVLTAGLLISTAAAAQSSRADSALMAPVVDQHNAWRKAHAPDLEPLVWSQSLADSAQGWAEHLAEFGRLVHDHNCCGPIFGNTRSLGENLAISDTPTAAAALWQGEKAFYMSLIKEGQECSAALGSRYNDCGHYKNIIQGRFTHIGCGFKDRTLVCRYGVSTQPGPKAAQKGPSTTHKVGQSYVLRQGGHCVTITAIEPMKPDGVRVSWKSGRRSGSFGGTGESLMDDFLGKTCTPKKKF